MITAKITFIMAVSFLKHQKIFAASILLIYNFCNNIILDVSLNFNDLGFKK